MHVSFSLRRIALVVALALLGLALPASAAKEDKFKASGTFIVTELPGSRFELTLEGHASPGGKFTGTAQGTSVSGGDHQYGELVMDFGGGDTLTMDFDVVYDPETDQLRGTYEITGGTGELEGATGSGELVADPAGDGTGTFEMDGTLSTP